MRNARASLAAAIAVCCMAASLGEVAAAPIDLPLRTWVKRRLPAPGSGPCPVACKHMRLALHPGNGRIYFEGGDYSTNSYYDSGRQETWSYAIADDTWRLEYPYCGPAGQVQPQHPDEVGWVYDSRRSYFWMLPGYMGLDTGPCSGGATVVRSQIMTFDPAAKIWSLPSRTELPESMHGSTKFAQYDPVEDTIIMFLYNGGPGVGVYNIAADTWDIRWTSGSGNISESWSGLDLEGRTIYVADGYRSKLWRYDMNSRTLQIIADTPSLLNPVSPHTIWDSTNRVLYLLDDSIDSDPSLARFYVYHPDTRQWETIPLVLPEDGGPVFGNHQIYDPLQNAFLVMGSTINPARPYFYLYRYGNGTGAPADSVAPRAPNDLRSR